MRVIDLFCGAGGFSQGLVDAGHEVVLAVDNWTPAIEVHALNHPQCEHWRIDINKIEASLLPKAEIIIGSPPCNTFSKARGKLTLDKKPTFKTLQLIKKYNPMYWLLENVSMWGHWIHKTGYGRDYIVRDAKHCGVPQRRVRHFYGRVPSGLFWPSLITPAFKCLKLSPDNFVHKESWQMQHGLTWRKLDQPMWTIDTKARLVFHKTYNPENLEKLRIRRMTAEDAAALQAFPEWYKFRGGKTTKIRMIGNAVPPPVGKSFFEGMNDGIK